MSAAVLVFKSAVVPALGSIAKLTLRPATCGVELKAYGDAPGLSHGVSLHPSDMRKLAVELLDLAQQKDGKDWVEEVGRV